MNWVKQNLVKLIFFTVAMGVVTLLFLGGSSAKCPDDFKNSDEKVAAFDKWTKDFYYKNPDASYTDLSEARRDFYIKHNCTEALKRHDDYLAGNVDPDTQQMIEGIINEYTDSSSCPYASTEEFTKDGGDFQSFTKDYFNQRPNPSSDEVDDATRKLLIYKGCGNILSEIDKLFQKRDANYPKSYSSQIGFSFQYASSLFVETYDGEENWIVIAPKSMRVNEDEPMTAIVISWANDNPKMSAEEWLNGPNSGYRASRDGKYTYRQIGGQNAVMTDTDWVVVKTPDNKTRISIAYLVQVEEGAKPLHAELQKILDTFSFK